MSSLRPTSVLNKIIKTLLPILLLSLLSCGDRDLTRQNQQGADISDIYLFGVSKNLNGYRSFLNLSDSEGRSLTFNLNTNRIKISGVTEGQIICSADTCTVNWFFTTPSDPENLTILDIIKRDLSITITTEPADFFVLNVEDSELEICDSSAGALQTGSKVTISLLSKEIEISKAYVFELGSPNSRGSLPVAQTGDIRKAAAFAFDFDSYFIGNGTEQFELVSFFVNNTDKPFFLVVASHPSHSASQRICMNED